MRTITNPFEQPLSFYPRAVSCRAWWLAENRPVSETPRRCCPRRCEPWQSSEIFCRVWNTSECDSRIRWTVCVCRCTDTDGDRLGQMDRGWIFGATSSVRKKVGGVRTKNAKINAWCLQAWTDCIDNYSGGSDWGFKINIIGDWKYGDISLQRYTEDERLLMSNVFDLSEENYFWLDNALLAKIRLNRNINNIFYILFLHNSTIYYHLFIFLLVILLFLYF